MKYTIGTFAELVGLTPDTLRLYEKHGIVKPMKDERNGYRYYDDLDVRNLLVCRLYRSFDIPLKQAADLTLKADADEIEEALEIQKRTLYKERSRLDMLIKTLETFSTDFENLHHGVDESLEIVDVTGIYWLRQTQGNTLLISSEIQARAASWMHALPEVIYTFRSTLADKKDLDWGMAIEAERFKELALERDDLVEYIPASKAVRYMFCEDQSANSYEKAIDKMAAYAMRQGHVARGDVWGRIVVNTQRSGIYLEAYLLLESQ